MFVKVIKATNGAWWAKHLGEIFEVRKPKSTEPIFFNTHYMLKNEVPNKYAVAIAKEDCVVLNDGQFTNKGVKHLLSKEE